MSRRAWYDKPVLDRWAHGLTILVLATSAPGVFSDFASQRSPWHMFVTAVWLLAALGLVASALLWLNRRNNKNVPTSLERRNPATFTTEAVTDAIASSPSRIAAIKHLRERIPGLRLGDAAHLIDRHLPSGT